MKKYSEYVQSDEERRVFSNELESVASSLGFDAYDSALNDIKISTFGLCSKCSFFKITKTEFRILLVKCGELNIRLNEKERVVECSTFVHRNQMSLNEMKEIAYIIESNHKKAGF